MMNVTSAIAVVVMCVALTACLHQAPVNVISCTGAPPLPLRPSVVDQMNRDELTRYNRYRVWWRTHCRQSISVPSSDLSTLR